AKLIARYADASPDAERRFARTNGDTNRDMDRSRSKSHIRLASRSFWIDDAQWFQSISGLVI
ncbi:MAG: hypothetical protein WAU74_18360, partial [Pseudolabrys sp.]